MIDRRRRRWAARKSSRSSADDVARLDVGPAQGCLESGDVELERRIVQRECGRGARRGTTRPGDLRTEVDPDGLLQERVPEGRRKHRRRPLRPARTCGADCAVPGQFADGEREDDVIGTSQFDPPVDLGVDPFRPGARRRHDDDEVLRLLQPLLQPVGQGPAHRNVTNVEEHVEDATTAGGFGELLETLVQCRCDVAADAAVGDEGAVPPLIGAHGPPLSRSDLRVVRRRRHPARDGPPRTSPDGRTVRTGSRWVRSRRGLRSRAGSAGSRRRWRVPRAAAGPCGTRRRSSGRRSRTAPG